MKQYLDMMKFVLNKGNEKKNRNNINTISYFGYQLRFDLNKGFPIITTKKIHFKSIVYELLWFIKGDTNIKYLVDNNIKIWNNWPYEIFCKSKEYNNESLDEFILKIKNSKIFAKKYGNLGPVYGKQWRNFNGIDQLKELINNLKKDPFSRRHIISAWNPNQIKKMLLPPCHTLMQFYISNKKEISCHLYQRSADIFLGVPFNISSYALLTFMLAKVCNFYLGELVISFGDCHIYLNHLNQVKEQLKRIPNKLPFLNLNNKINSLFNFDYNDICLENYISHPILKGDVSV